MTHLTLNMLGDLQVLMDDVPIHAFESDKVRALLAYLAVEADRPHRRSTLIGLLWPDCLEEVARHNLRQALFNLRLALGDHTAKPPYLLISHDAIQFNRESNYSLDLVLFNEFSDLWEKNQNAGAIDQPNLILKMEDMVNLYRGEFLQHFFLSESSEFEDWIVLQREMSRQHMMDALSWLANQHELLEDFQTARRFATHQLELDPWREEVHCQIMRVLALDGHRSAALAQYESCRKLLAKELGVEPSPQTRELYEQIRSGALKTKDKTTADIPSVRVHNLPTSLTPFIGREQELAELDRLIGDPQCRCITLVGAGGIGKTRLALQAAEQHRTTFAHGAAFVPLASVASKEAVIPAIADGLGFAFSGPLDAKMQLFHYLQGKQIMLVLDNLEHLLVEGPLQGTVVELLIEILHQAEAVKLVITSREPLHLQGEWPFEVQGLSFPRVEQTDRFEEYSAVALFVQRARRACPGFEMNIEDKAGIVRLCRLVDGLPLAIELAATWVRILSPSEIATEIENSLDFLNTSMRDVPERHRSIRAVFDRSWETLSTDEKRVLGRLSVFRGGFQRHAAEQVAGATLPVLSSLVIRSLLRRMATGRYDLHELIRQYAASKLTEDPLEMQDAQEQHSQYYLGLLEEKDAKLKSNQQKQAVAELTAEIGNIRVAWDWSIANQKFIPLYRVSFTLCYLFEQRNWFTQGETTFWKTAQALQTRLEGAVQDDSAQRVALNAMLAHCGFFQFRQGRSKEAYAILAPSAAFLRTSAESYAAIYSLYYLGIDCWILGRFSEAKESLQESLALSRKSGRRWFEAMAGEFLGRLELEQGAYEQARQYLSKAVAILRQVGDPSMVAHVLSCLGPTMQRLGEFREAEKLLQESLELAREIDYRHGMGLALDGLGEVTYAQGNFEEARTFFSEAAILFQESGDTHRLSRALNHQGLNALALDDTTGAEDFFKTALRFAHEGSFTPATLDALVGLSTLDVQQEARPKTLELVLYILQHPSSTQETKKQAARLRAELEAELSEEELEAAQQRAMSKSLNEHVRQVLASG